MLVLLLVERRHGIALLYGAENPNAGGGWLVGKGHAESIRKVASCLGSRHVFGDNRVGWCTGSHALGLEDVTGEFQVAGEELR